MNKFTNNASECFMKFWGKSFDLSEQEMASPEPRTVNSGKYVERYGDEYIYLFEDLVSGKKVWAGTEFNLKKDFSELKIVFEDIDYILPHSNSFIKFETSKQVRLLKQKDKSEVLAFQEKLSEDDKDTLDITFEKETLFGIFEDHRLVGVSRYVSLRDETQIADITVVIDSPFRGMGFGLPLVSALVSKLLEGGLTPRYRVNRHLDASIKIAQRLGFKPRFQLTTYS